MDRFISGLCYIKKEGVSNFDSVSDISLPLMMFQENHNLSVDGLLNVVKLSKTS